MTTTTTEPPRLVRVEEAARLLNVGRSLAYELVRTGRLRSLKLGNRRLIPREAIEEMIAALTDEQGSH
ncbi:helix-turn-helix domain-containing protein [Planosporangium mesophilum]|uniref:Helix-turn-helix domain-containing protein n=1 Tax=Planosporangium mesophilum TaxID=689768 RepID=A0A8J3X3C3_9ACTN|nr:helix-turn-helix domain-containing protein [Planosporangium mesophilum]NJC83675.1 helix-turn-helix domain-containing protein [Planosporangium mesophilum]GII25339.1 hypothetical protein Pme01_49360 [Planosporangium mesophilum]